MDGISTENIASSNEQRCVDPLQSRMLTVLLQELLTTEQRENLDPADKYNTMFELITEGITNDDLYEDSESIS